jgi:hypothetical protein
VFDLLCISITVERGEACSSIGSQVTAAPAGRGGIVKEVLPGRYWTLTWLGQNAYVEYQHLACGLGGDAYKGNECEWAIYEPAGDRKAIWKFLLAVHTQPTEIATFHMPGCSLR